jgi:hypothetical protein
MPYFTFKSRPKDLNFSKALYVKSNQGKIGLEKIQNFLNKYFLFEIVSKLLMLAKIKMLRYINEAISKHDIDMLVQTQEIKFIKLKKEELHEKVQLLFCRYMKN